MIESHDSIPRQLEKDSRFQYHIASQVATVSTLGVSFDKRFKELYFILIENRKMPIARINLNLVSTTCSATTSNFFSFSRSCKTRSKKER